jgi:RimJ/RimL family protein N-acetyltransferase
MTQIVTQTPRLILRTEAEGDRAVWRAHMNCDRTMAHLGGPQTPERIDASFDRMRDGFAATGWPFLLVARREDGLLIGKCGLVAIDTEAAPAALRGQIQIGWTVRPDMWGQGYAREAAGAMLDFAFTERDVAIVFGQTSQGNTGSWRLMDKLAMQRRTDLDYVDPAYPAKDNPTIIYAMTRDQWLACPQEQTI